VKISSGTVVISFGLQLISTWNFHIFQKISIEFGIEGFHAMSILSYKFRDRRCSESHTSLRGVNKVLLRFYTFRSFWIKFPTVNIHKIALSDCECHGRRHCERRYFTYRRQQNSVGNLHIYSAVWLNWGIMYLAITLLWNCEFRIIHIREGPLLFLGT
jgi:hypothetical protein